MNWVFLLLCSTWNLLIPFNFIKLGQGVSATTDQPIYTTFRPCIRNKDRVLWKHYKSIVESASIVYTYLKRLAKCLQIFKKICMENGFRMSHVFIEEILEALNTHIYNPASYISKTDLINMKDLIKLLKIHLDRQPDDEEVVYTATAMNDHITPSSQQVIGNFKLISSIYLMTVPIVFTNRVKSEQLMMFICHSINFIGFNFFRCYEKLHNAFNLLKDALAMGFIKKRGHNSLSECDKNITLMKKGLDYTRSRILSRINSVIYSCHVIGLLELNEDFLRETDATIPDLVLQYVDLSLLSLLGLRNHQKCSLYNTLNRRSVSTQPRLPLKHVDLRIIHTESGLNCLLFSENVFSISSIIEDLLKSCNIPLVKTVKDRFPKWILFGQNQCIGSSYVLNENIILSQNEADLSVRYRLYDPEKHILVVADRIFPWQNFHQMSAIQLILTMVGVHIFKRGSVETSPIRPSSEEDPILSLIPFNICKVGQKTTHNYSIPVKEKDLKAENTSVSEFPGSSFAHFFYQSYSFSKEALDTPDKESPHDSTPLSIYSEEQTLHNDLVPSKSPSTILDEVRPSTPLLTASSHSPLPINICRGSIVASVETFVHIVVSEERLSEGEKKHILT